MRLANDTFPGATVIRPIPDVVLRFAIGWIPRALWHNKPGFSAAGEFINKMYSGGTAKNTSTMRQTGGTACVSVAGLAYVGYGIPGVIEMGLLFGWLCRLTEEILWLNLRRPLTVMFALGLATWMFRCFRDLTPFDLYPLLIGVLFMILTILFMRPFVYGGRATLPSVVSGEFA
jgi:hypothetical protein